MARKVARYAVVDAFTDTPFKGNPAAVCFLEEGEGVDDDWMQAVAKEFNLSETAFLKRFTTAGPPASNSTCFHLRWFTPVAEVDLCGHATLASAHFLLTSGITEAHTLEFLTRSGILKATKLDLLKENNLSRPCNDGGESFLIELNFPLIEAINVNSAEIPSIPNTLNGLSIVNIQKGNEDGGDIIVELSSGEDVTNLKPNFDELCKCAGRGVIVTAPAPPGSDFDFFSRFFCPKFGINEDPVTGSAHCLLAPYWSKKLGKQNLMAYQASPRGGILKLQLDEPNQRVLIRGEAVTVMTGTLFA
ncbi:uncharacterized protein LOC110092449 [Dendrobium catenatum]|uniref:uncharacterized protein LOC110092449 n=1 Tax=Dendrobium catenatum TaxID=906689 RepID=UPI0010A0485C|nr:uncharacterized protein LOC110092449 [Dendrobium catenatum]